MPRAISLVRPDTTRYSAYIDCVTDFAGTSMDGSGIRDPQQPPVAEGDVTEFVTARRHEEDPASELPDGWVHCTSRWIVDAETDEMLGFIATRHRLTPYLLEQGGHIGYSVRPAARRQGIASAALELALVQALTRDVDPDLVPGADHHPGSRRTIEKAGGPLADIREGKRRYWFGDGPRPRA